MKKQYRLLKYYFESLNIKFPQFPGSDGGIVVKNSWEYTLFLNAKKKNLFAYRLMIKLFPLKKKNQKDLYISIGIIGIFNVPGGFQDRKQKLEFVQKLAPKTLNDIIKNHLDGILSHSLFKPPIR